MSAINEVYDFLKKAGTYYLATTEGNQPRVRPFGTVNLFENRLYIQTGKSKNVSKQLAANPKAEICAFHEGKWLRVSTVLVEDDRVAPKKDMLDHYPELRSMYDENSANTQVLYLTGSTAVFSSFTEPPKTVVF